MTTDHHRFSATARPLGLILQVLALMVSAAAAAAPFAGTIGKTLGESTPAWPESPHPPQDAPNVLIWLMDDVGYGQVNSFGGLVETDTLDGLAQSGLRFSNFHATPLCSPTRAALLSGRNPHAVGIGAHANTAAGFPGYTARIPKSAAGIGRILKDQGYATYALGKWDQLPSEHVSALGPFDYWPSGQGFEHFYGFLHYDANHFRPHLWRDHTPVTDKGVGDPDYHLTADLADQAAGWIRQQASLRPEQPFLMYWSTGAVHAPHHAPTAYLEKYRGKFDMGWNAARELILARQKKLGLVPADTRLPPWPEGVPTWDSLTAEQRRLAARAMEAFAAMLDHADHQFGRILKALEEAGELDNTIILVTSDNGASAEGGLAGSVNEILMGRGTWEDNLPFLDAWGGPDTYPHYPVGWAAAGNTPFKYYKQSAFEGGHRVPMVINWPRGLAAKGELRPQFHHVNDILPTVLDLVGITAPSAVAGVTQQPMDGISFRYALADPQAPDRKKVQYFELWGNHGLWADGWKANLQLRPEPWNIFSKPRLEDARWELYHVAEDINERVNLAASYPEKLAEMQALFHREAERNNVYPLLDDLGLVFAAARERQLSDLEARGGRYTYLPGTARVPMSVAPPLGDFPFTAKVTLRDGAATDGVLFAQGGSDGGVALYLSGGRPILVVNHLGLSLDRIEAAGALPAGSVTLEVHLSPLGSGGAEVRLRANGVLLAEGKVSRFPVRMGPQETFDLGADYGSQVDPDRSVDQVIAEGLIQHFEVDIHRPGADS